MKRAAAASSRGSPRAQAGAKSVRNIDSGGIATSGPRSRISRSIVVPDRSLPTMKNGSRIAAHDDALRGEHPWEAEPAQTATLGTALAGVAQSVRAAES